MPAEITYTSDLSTVDWQQLKSDLADDQFDNGRTVDQLRQSFENSGFVQLAWSDNRLIGTARVLSDGVCNAYLVDLWTQSAFRRRGIATECIAALLEWAESQGCHRFRASVSPDNDASLAIIRAFGFHQVGVQMDEFDGEELVFHLDRPALEST